MCSYIRSGFSSEYGGRLSSVTEINGKDGNKNEMEFGADMSLPSINLIVGGVCTGRHT